MNQAIPKARWWNKRRMLALFLSAALLLGITTAGTFAWQAIGEQALIEARDQGVNPGGRLHDDFDGANKDVYVENYGTIDIYARVRLFEYMEIGDGAGRKSLDGGVTQNPDHHAVSFRTGADIDHVDTWTVHIPDASAEVCAGGDHDTFHNYWSWKLGGSKVYMPTFNRDSGSLQTDISGAESWVSGAAGYEHRVSDPQGGVNVFGKPGTHHQYADGDRVTHDAVYKTRVVQEEHVAQSTLAGGVLTVAQWVQGGGQPGAYWVVDADGWAYWAQPIAPKTATGLLLDSIALTQEMEDEWYYAIFVSGQFVSARDMATVRGGGDIAPGGEAVIDACWLSKKVHALTLTASGAYAATAMAGDTLRITLSADSADRTIDLTCAVSGDHLGGQKTSWTATGANAAWGAVNSSDSEAYTVTLPANATGTLQVVAAAKDDPAKCVTVEITVTALPPQVTAYRVEASGAASGAADAGGSIHLMLQRDAAPQTITLTGTVAGSHLTATPGQSTWTRSGVPAGWTVPAADASYITIVIPANGAGDTTVTARVKDDPTQAVTVHIHVTDYTLFYSEGNVTYGASTDDATHRTATAFTLRLTSPVGGVTERYFTTDRDTPGAWALDAGTTGATLRAVSANRRYAVSIPANAVGTARLTIGGYTVTLIVAADDGTDTAAAAQSKAAAAQVGETFRASGIEWRVLRKEGGAAVLMAEHVLDKQKISPSYVSNEWKTSPLRTALNDGTYAYSADRLSFSDVLKDTHLVDTDTVDRVFLPLMVPANDTLGVFASRDCFADEWSTRATWAGSFPGDSLWTRTTKAPGNWMSFGFTANGTGISGGNEAQGIRPICVIELA